MGLLDIEPEPADTPIFDHLHEDFAGARAAGLEWHPHWRLQDEWAREGEREMWAAFEDVPF